MAEGGTFTFSDSDGYVAAFGDVRFNLTITGAGDFKARLTRLKLDHLEFYDCFEDLPRIGYMALPQRRIFLSFPISNVGSTFNGYVSRNGDMILHVRGGSLHHRIDGKNHWGLISVSPEVLAHHSEALTGRPFVPSNIDRILRPGHAEAGRLRRLFTQVCRLSEPRLDRVGRPEVARALEQQLVQAIIHCLSSDEQYETSKTRRQHAGVITRLEEILNSHVGQKLTMPTLCVELGVAERTLRMCCAEFLGVSPTRYMLLQRMNRARAALQSADPSTSSVAQVARNHHFLELGRFAVTYRNIFGESPSATLHRRTRT